MKTPQLVLAVIVVLLVIAAGFYYFSTNGTGSMTPSVATSTGATTTPAKTTTSKTTTTSGSSKTTTTATPSYAPSLEGVSLSVSPTSGPAPLTAKFVGAFPVSLNGSYTFSMTYGDGTSEPVTSSCIGTNCTVNVSHVYKISGNFTPELSAITKCATIVPVSTDCPHTSYVIAKAPLTVTGGESSATLSLTPSSGKTGESIQILVKGSGSTLVVTFGDGTTHTLAPMTDGSISLDHTYATPGTYAVKVTSGTQILASQDEVIQSGT